MVTVVMYLFHSPLSSVEVKNEWSYISTPIHLHGVVFS